MGAALALLPAAAAPAEPAETTVAPLRGNTARRRPRAGSRSRRSGAGRREQAGRTTKRGPPDAADLAREAAGVAAGPPRTRGRPSLRAPRGQGVGHGPELRRRLRARAAARRRGGAVGAVAPATSSWPSTATPSSTRRSTRWRARRGHAEARLEFFRGDRTELSRPRRAAAPGAATITVDDRGSGARSSSRRARI